MPLAAEFSADRQIRREKKIIVTPETVIVTYVPSDKSELKPGAKIFIAGANRALPG